MPGNPLQNLQGYGKEQGEEDGVKDFRHPTVQGSTDSLDHNEEKRKE